MRLLNGLIVSGFLVCILSFLILAMGYSRNLSAYFFIVGFYMASTGMVLKIVSINSRLYPRLFGIKIFAIGFFISSLNFLFEYFKVSQEIGIILSWIGGFMIFFGLVVAIFSKNR